MKKLIEELLINRKSSRSEYKVADLPYFLRPLFRDVEGGGIIATDNVFWQCCNITNRRDLVVDMRGYTDSVREGTKFTVLNRAVLNRIENGDAYGIGSGSCYKIRRCINGGWCELELTPKEQREAYDTQRLAYYESDIENMFDVVANEDYETYGIRKEDAEQLFGDMALRMVRNIDKHDMQWQYAADEAIKEVAVEFMDEEIELDTFPASDEFFARSFTITKGTLAWWLDQFGDGESIKEFLDSYVWDATQMLYLEAMSAGRVITERQVE